MWRFRDKSSYRKGKEKKSVARGNSKSSDGEGLGSTYGKAIDGGRRIQLFRERLSGKVHVTILKGIVGGFEFSFFQRNLNWHERPWKCVCEC